MTLLGYCFLSGGISALEHRAPLLMSPFPPVQTGAGHQPEALVEQPGAEDSEGLKQEMGLLHHSLFFAVHFGFIKSSVV